MLLNFALWKGIASHSHHKENHVSSTGFLIMPRPPHLFPHGWQNKVELITHNKKMKSLPCLHNEYTCVILNGSWSMKGWRTGQEAEVVEGCSGIWVTPSGCRPSAGAQAAPSGARWAGHVPKTRLVLGRGLMRQYRTGSWWFPQQSRGFGHQLGRTSLLIYKMEI